MNAVPTLTPGRPTTGLTGRHRFRIGVFGAVVLEVEYFWTGMPLYSRHVETEKRWRDACALDLVDARIRHLIEGVSS